MAAMVQGESQLTEILERGYTLPADWYTSEEIFRKETDQILRKTWQYVGPSSRLPESGSYFTCSIGNVPLIIIRDDGDTFRAFVNVCRHRSHEVATGEGKRRSLQCPYHGWTYGLDGSLHSAPRCDRESSTFDTDELSLLPAAIDRWGDLLFVNLNHTSSSLDEVLRPLRLLAEERGFRLEDHRHRGHFECLIQGNWKAWVDNSVECYHCPLVHKGFSGGFDLDPAKYNINCGEGFISEWTAPRDGPGDPFAYQLYYFWPTFLLSAKRDTYRTITAYPLAPGQTRVEVDVFAHKTLDAKAADGYLNSAKEILAEDVGCVESVQRGHRAGVVRHGRLLLDSEHPVQRFQKWVVEALSSFDS